MERDRIEISPDWRDSFEHVIASIYSNTENKSITAVVTVRLGDGKSTIVYEVDDHGVTKVRTSDLGLAIEAYNEL